MGERKVLNKYYPPDFDPAKLPKLELTKERQYVVRLMAPFTMRCLTCGNYVYKGKKFNARKETAVGEKYLGIQIFRFYIRCPQCLSEISFKTDPKSTDYVLDNGAYRTFQAERIAEMEEERIVQEKEEDEANNPMLALENRTKESRMEMDVLDALEEIRDWNARNAQVKFDDLMGKHLEDENKLAEEIEERDKEMASKVFDEHRMVKRLRDEDEETEDGIKLPAASDIDIFVSDSKKVKTEKSNSTTKPLVNSRLTSMIVKKKVEPINSGNASGSQLAVPSGTSSLTLLNTYSSSDEDSS